MVPKNEVWSRKVSETKARRAGRVPESDGWSAWVVPESGECRKTRLGVLEGYPKATLGVKGGYREAKSGMPVYLPEGIAGQRYIYIYIYQD